MCYILMTKALLQYILCSIVTINGGYMTQEYIDHLKEDDSKLHIFYIGCKLIPETTFKRGYNE